MHFVIILLAVLALFLYLTLGVAKNPDKKKFFYLYLLIDIWLSAVFVYLLVSAFSS
jgi:F0F1-type ATP synthase membrane subunit c/vacuolar-type H+-ATPase subunit K